MNTRLESTTYDTIMAALENWIYDSGSYQTKRYILDRPHKVPQITSKISGQSRNRYNTYCKFYLDFDWWYFMPIRNLTQLHSPRPRNNESGEPKIKGLGINSKIIISWLFLTISEIKYVNKLLIWFSKFIPLFRNS